MYKRIDFDGRGLAYVKDHVTAGNVLCNGLAAVVDSEPGDIYTLVPVETNAERIYDFASGGLLVESLDYSRAIPLTPRHGSLMPVSSLADLRGQIIMSELRTHPGSICICDDFNSDWSAPHSRDWPTAFGVDNETYHLITLDTGLDMLSRILRMTDTLWHGATAVCLSGLQLEAACSASPESLLACTSSVTQITCSAYDGEGFVVWQRTSQPSLGNSNP